MNSRSSYIYIFPALEFHDLKYRTTPSQIPPIMYTTHSLYFLTLISLALAAPPPPSNPTVKCYDGSTPAANADDCTHLLESLSKQQWVHERITYGRQLPVPGRIPFSTRYGSCELTMENSKFMSKELGTFTFVKYFPFVYGIIDNCFRGQEIPFRAGVVDVEREGKFVVILSGLVPRNETVGSSEAMSAENRISGA